MVDYHLRKANGVTDALSRKTISVFSLQHCNWRFTPDGTLLAQLRSKPDLKQMIINAQKYDVKLQQTVQLVKDGDKTNYLVEDNGGVYYKNRL